MDKIGQNGSDGYTPVKGTDYWTQADIESMESDILSNIPPEIFYWDGATDSNGLAFWNNVYTVSRTKDVIVFKFKSSEPVVYSIRKNQSFSSGISGIANVTKNERSDYTQIKIPSYKIIFVFTDNEITTVAANDSVATLNCLVAEKNYNSPYTPQYNGSPATKKYVDDSITSAITNAIGGAY